LSHDSSAGIAGVLYLNLYNSNDIDFAGPPTRSALLVAENS